MPSGYSPADDFIDESLDLNELIVGQQDAAMFFVRVSGESMQGVGICDGDLLAVNRALEAKRNPDDNSRFNQPKDGP